MIPILKLCILHGDSNFMDILANTSDDPDEIPHNAAFHQSLQYLLRQKLSSEKEIQFYLEIKTSEPFIYMYTMDHILPCLHNKTILTANFFYPKRTF